VVLINVYFRIEATDDITHKKDVILNKE